MNTPHDTGRYTVGIDLAGDNNSHALALGLIGSGKRVLEVGCWTGHVTEALVAAGNRVVGVEVDHHAAQAARTWAERVHVIDLDTTPLSSVEADRFDVVLLGDVLEHLRDPAAVLADAVTRLSDGGRVVVSLPHVGHIDIRLMLLEGRWEYQDDGLLDRTHLRWFTRDSIRELLAGAGLVATEVRRVYFYPGDTNVPFTPGLHSPDVIRFVEADPEARTYQFVVAAERARPGLTDALADPPPVTWPDLATERAALEAELAHLRQANQALANEVAAWNRSTLVRLTAPLRRLRRRLEAR